VNAEDEDRFRLRNAAEFLARSRDQENQARIALARAVEQTKTAKSKYEDLFMACEDRAVARRKAAFALGETR
jgi:hypothetical protein